jgi:hypothetical protein
MWLIKRSMQDRRERGCFGFIEGFSRCCTIGYYAMVGIFLKSFDVRPPDGSTPLK